MLQYMNWIKQIWKDTDGGLSTRQLFFKYLAPFVAVFVCWIFIGRLFISLSGVNSMVVNKGTVTDLAIKIKRYQDFGSRFTHNEHNLSIGLSNYKYNFIVREDFVSSFENLTPPLHPGDTITIYTLSRTQSLLNGSSGSDVYQVVKDGKIIFPFSEMRKFSLNRAILPGFYFFIFWVACVAHWRQRLPDN